MPMSHPMVQNTIAMMRRRRKESSCISPPLEAAEVREREQVPEDRENDHDDELSKEGVPAVHIFSNRGIEPDYSGYVDEYRFTPLTPALEKALATMVKTRSFDRRDEAEELERLGYIRDLTFYLAGSCRFDVTAKGSRYAEELAAYRLRRDRWAESREAERKRDLWVQFAQGLITALVGAAIGAAATLAAVS